MKCYHMTSMEHLKSIEKYGLIPKNENNSKLIKDNQVKVFFSEGFEGAIALFIDFNIVYNDLKNKVKKINYITINNDINKSRNLEEYLGEGVYLSFDMADIFNERNFENGCTDKIIKPNRLKVLILENKKDKTIIFSRFEIIKYMMAKINPKDIKYYGEEYLGSPNFEDATKKIQEKVNKYYNENIECINKYKNDIYYLKEISLKDFLKNI